VLSLLGHNENDVRKFQCPLRVNFSRAISRNARLPNPTKLPHRPFAIEAVTVPNDSELWAELIRGSPRLRISPIWSLLRSSVASARSRSRRRSLFRPERLRISDAGNLATFLRFSIFFAATECKDVLGVWLNARLGDVINHREHEDVLEEALHQGFQLRTGAPINQGFTARRL
jgi:hypothetical protein